MADVPVGVWGIVETGELGGANVIVEQAESGGYDICLFPPSPARDVWYHWAMDQSDLAAWFGIHELSEEDLRERLWVWSGYLSRTSWGVRTIPDEDPRLSFGAS